MNRRHSRASQAAVKAMAAVRPRTVRQFFTLANKHLRWELNDLARRSDSSLSLSESFLRGFNN